MGDIYTEILRAQVKQGNFGGKSGAFGHLAKKEKKEKKEKKAPSDKPVVGKSLFAINLKMGTVTDPQDSNGLADPFIKLVYLNADSSRGKEIWCSKVCSKTLTPIWDQYDTFKIRDDTKNIAVELWDHDMLSANDFIGYNAIDVTPSRKGKMTHDIMVFENIRDNKIRGSVEFTLEIK